MDTDDWPTFAQCAGVLRAAGMREPLTERRRLDGGYSPNSIHALNDRYLLRSSRAPGSAARYRREAAALARAWETGCAPKVLGAGTFAPGQPGSYLLLTLLPGDNLFRSWLGAPDDVRAGVAGELAGAIRRIHAIATARYQIGYYATALRDWDGTWLAGHDTYMERLLGRVRAGPLDAESVGLARDAEAFYAAHRAALERAVGPRFTHGDLHLYNVIVAEGHVTGIVDWEWSYDGGGEPDFDLTHLVRWALYPADPAEEALEARVTAADYAPLIPALLAAYPEVAATPTLLARMTIYQLEHELHALIQCAQWWPDSPTAAEKPKRRLRGWLHEGVLARYFP